MLSLEIAFALANHIRDVPIFLKTESRTGSLCSDPWLVKTPTVHFLQLSSSLIPTPEGGLCLTHTKTSWDGQAGSSAAWTCTCDRDEKKKKKSLPPGQHKAVVLVFLKCRQGRDNAGR